MNGKKPIAFRGSKAGRIYSLSSTASPAKKAGGCGCGKKIKKK
ncbi:MAG TPA: hypothetical protein VEY68_13400 [Anoxybacillus sp.]|jgi:hypothetical protein|nr:hypothetical protein [Anoxybacillus sp.]